MKTRMRQRKKKPSAPKGTNAKHLGRSIEERDASVLSRNEVGHWEVDLVLGKKAKGEPVVINLEIDSVASPSIISFSFPLTYPNIQIIHSQ